MERHTFSPRHLALLEHLRESLEACGFTCEVEVTFMMKHMFELHTLVATPPTKPTRAERGCNLLGDHHGPSD